MCFLDVKKAFDRVARSVELGNVKGMALIVASDKSLRAADATVS